MKASVLIFPGSNCDRDIKVALEGCGADVSMIWHSDSELPKSDIVILPGGFSYGDYLRSGAIAAHSPIMKEVFSHAEKGGYVLGICNGFQVLTETHLLPGTLMRNRDLKFICKKVSLKIENHNTVFTNGYSDIDTVTFPVAHHDGNYFIEGDELKELEDNDQIAFRYSDSSGAVNDNSNPNGSMENIAGVYNKEKNILGLMPHPERVWEEDLGGTDGRIMFESLIKSIS